MESELVDILPWQITSTMNKAVMIGTGSPCSVVHVKSWDNFQNTGLHVKETNEKKKTARVEKRNEKGWKVIFVRPAKTEYHYTITVPIPVAVELLNETKVPVKEFGDRAHRFSLLYSM